MKDKPSGQRLYKAFDGDWDVLTDAQILNLKEIIELEAKKLDELFTYICSERQLD